MPILPFLLILHRWDWPSAAVTFKKAYSLGDSYWNLPCVAKSGFILRRWSILPLGDFIFERKVKSITQVLAFLKPHIGSRQLLPAQGESAGQKLSSGDWLAAMAPPVNISQLNPAQVGFAVPKEGAPAYVDRLGIPKGSRNPKAALDFIDWWFRPENAASFCRYTLQYPYAKGVYEVLAEREPELAANPLIFPPADVLERLFPYPAPWDMRERAQIARLWTRMVSG